MRQTSGPSSRPTSPSIYLAEADWERLWGLLNASNDDHAGRNLSPLEACLTRAKVVAREKLPPGVVTMNSRIVYEEAASGARREVTLVYPGDADFDAGRLSVMAPVGASLLGLRVGQVAEGRMPGGHLRRFRIIELR